MFHVKHEHRSHCIPTLIGPDRTVSAIQKALPNALLLLVECRMSYKMLMSTITCILVLAYSRV